MPITINKSKDTNSRVTSAHRIRRRSLLGAALLLLILKATVDNWDSVYATWEALGGGQLQL